MKYLSIFFILIVALSASGQTSIEIVLGNPSNASAYQSNADNYLVGHDGYILSYNKSRGAANWVEWHLAKSDVGTVDRSNAFAPDQKLPRDWWIKPNDYAASGYDRGHLCPSKDRSASEESNRETFLMSNMQPQTPKLNQKTWKYLENYERELVRQGNEAYIYAGCYGDLGKINTKITIPARCWKIIVVLTEGENDLKRIDKKTRVIAVDMPNDETLSQRWRTYLTTIDAIEGATGYDFLSTVSKKIQKTIESAKDTASETSGGGGDNDEPAAAPPPASSTTKGNQRRSGDRLYQIGSRGGCFYLTAPGKKSYVDKKFCEISSPAAAAGQKAEEPSAPVKSNDSGGRIYIRGPRGGCYYLTASGKKTYVDKSLCN